MNFLDQIWLIPLFPLLGALLMLLAVAAILSMAEQLGLETLAEGVEVEFWDAGHILVDQVGEVLAQAPGEQVAQAGHGQLRHLGRGLAGLPRIEGRHAVLDRDPVGLEQRPPGRA